MMYNREFLLDIFERFGNDAQAAIDFVRKNEKKEEAATVANPIVFNKKDDILPNGVYIVLKNGDFYRYYKDEESYDNVDFIGIAHDGHTFGVPLNGNLGEHQLLKSQKKPKDDKCVCEIEALIDWDFVSATKHIQELGTDIPFGENQYMPTAPVWIAMYANKENLNSALSEYDGTPIELTENYWFAQRYSSTDAWFFSGNNGILNDYSCTYELIVQAVVLWNP